MGDVEILGDLVEAGANLAIENNEGHTALDVAIFNSKYESAFLLLQKGKMARKEDIFYFKAEDEKGSIKSILHDLDLGLMPEEVSKEKEKMYKKRQFERSKSVLGRASGSSTARGSILKRAGMALRKRSPDARDFNQI